jgi:CIC family chloride channel protein
VVFEGAPVEELVQHLGRSEQMYFPVVDEGHHLVGVIGVAELGHVVKDGSALGGLLVAGDIARPSETVTPDDTLLEAVRKMGVRGVPSVPVIDPRTGHLLGLISRTHVLNAYERVVNASHVSASHGGGAGTVHATT